MLTPLEQTIDTYENLRASVVLLRALKGKPSQSQDLLEAAGITWSAIMAEHHFGC